MKIIEFNSNQECLDYENEYLRNISKQDRTDYLNIAFYVSGSVTSNQSHNSITDGSGVFIKIPRNLEIPEGWWVEWNIKPPRHKGKILYVDLETKKTVLCLPENKPENYISAVEHKKYIKSLKPKKTIWVTNGVKNKKISTQEILEESWRKGKTVKQHPRGIHRKKRLVGSTANTYAVNNGVNNFFIRNGEPVPENCVKGALQPSRIATKSITNEIVNKTISVKESIPVGWRLGRAKYKCQK